MSLKQAVSEMNRQAAPAKPANFFDGFDDWMEAKEPGWKVGEQARGEGRAKCAGDAVRRARS